MRFDIFRSPIAYIDVNDNLTDITVVIDALPTQTPAWFDISRYNDGYRYVSVHEFYEIRNNVQEIIDYPEEFARFRYPICLDGPKIIIRGLSNLRLEKERKPEQAPYGFNQLMDRNFVCSNQYQLFRLFDAGLIGDEHYVSVTNYYQNRFLELSFITDNSNKRDAQLVTEPLGPAPGF